MSRSNNEPHGSIDKNALLMKFTPEGSQVWTRDISTLHDESDVDMVIDKNSNIYISGATEGEMVTGSSLDKYSDVWLSKFSPNGDEVWRVQFGNRGTDNVTALSVDNEGNIYIAGRSYKSDFFAVRIRKISSDGKELWSIYMPFDDIGGDIRGIVSDDAGNIYTFTGDEYRELYLLSFSPVGEERWRAKCSLKKAISNGITIDKKANIYIGGTIHPEDATVSTNIDTWIAKYSSDGNELWIESKKELSIQQGQALAIDHDGTIYFSGRGKDGAWLKKISHDGAELLHHPLGKDGAWGCQMSIAPDLSGNVYVVGKFKDDRDKTWLAKCYNEPETIEELNNRVRLCFQVLNNLSR